MLQAEVRGTKEEDAFTRTVFRLTGDVMIYARCINSCSSGTAGTVWSSVSYKYSTCKVGTHCTCATNVRKATTSELKIEVKIGVFLSSLLGFEFGIVVFSFDIPCSYFVGSFRCVLLTLKT
jgi:hypothetical protein